MFEPQKNNQLYLILFIIITLLIGFSFIKYYKYLIIQSNCSEIAAKSSDFIYNKPESNDYTYEKVKNKCLNDFGIK